MPNCGHRELSTLASPVWLQVSSHTSEICSGSSAEANTLQSLGKSGAGYPAHTPHGAHHSQGSLPACLSRSFSIAQEVSQSYDTTQWGDQKTDLHNVLSIPTQPRRSSTRFRTRETRATHLVYNAVAKGKHRAVSCCKALMYLCKNVLLYKCMHFFKNAPFVGSSSCFKIYAFI